MPKIIIALLFVHAFTFSNIATSFDGLDKWLNYYQPIVKEYLISLEQKNMVGAIIPSLKVTDLPPNDRLFENLKYIKHIYNSFDKTNIFLSLIHI